MLVWQITAKLRNPLAGIPRETLMANVEEFAEQKGLQNKLDILKRGAILAQNPVCSFRPCIWLVANCHVMLLLLDLLK